MSKPKKSQEIVDWSTPPYVDKDAADDFAQMMSDEYEGMNEPTAKTLFTQHGMNWDTYSAPEFAGKINEIRGSLELSDELGPAMFVFCDKMIPLEHRKAWVIAVMAARDVHEGG